MKNEMINSEGKFAMEVNKLQSLIEADISGCFNYQSVIAAGAGKEWESFKALLLALKPVILDKLAIGMVRTKIRMTYSKQIEFIEKLSGSDLSTRVDNMTKDRLAIISNLHKIAAGGKKGDVVVHGAGWGKVEALVKAHKTGGIKGFKSTASNAVPEALRPAGRAATGAAGNTNQTGQGAAKAKAEAKAPSDPIVVNRVAMLRALDNVLVTIVTSDIFKPGTDAKLLKLVTDLEKLVELELEAPAPAEKAA
jgi:hypothetical protein